MPRSKKLVENAWYDFVKQHVEGDVTVIFSDQSSPRPAKPYVVLKIIAGPTGVGFDELRFNSAQPLPSTIVKYDLEGLRNYTMNIQAFAPSVEEHRAMDIINKLHTLLDSPLTTEFFKKNQDIAIVNRGQPTDITALMETEYEQRTSLDVIFRTTQSVEVNPSCIEQVGIGGTIILTDTDEITVEEFEVPPSP